MQQTRVEARVSGRDLVMSFETGKLALQADGAVVGRIGDTVVLVTATAAKTVREGIDFFPLTVDIEERMYAAGKIPGSFFRREGRATDQATLVARLIDRPLRPSFKAGFRHEVHVVGTILGADQVNPHDVIAINAASAALMISGIPFEGPVGAVRLAYTKEGTWIPHPTYQEGDASSIEIVVAGREVDGDIAIMMVEAGGTESAWANYQAGAPKVTEAVIAEGLEVSKRWIKEAIYLQRELVAKAGSKPEMAWEPISDYGADVYQRLVEVGLERIAAANATMGKTERNEALEAVTAQLVAELLPEFPEREKEIREAVRSLTKEIVRRRIVEEGVRIDGRRPDEIRELYAEVGLIPTAHGSALFQRGETQVLNVTTLGMPRMNQQLDTIGVDEVKRYMHHYNMPPFATGEVGFMRGPRRREIGHGLLAERALVPVVPPEEEFPYAMRLVSEVLSSNGSTSMASVCGSTLSLMDAGVPLRAPVAGIAMGLVHAEGRYVTLTDILGAEDAFGDMDFKVAGTAEFITALQLDTKISGLPSEVLAKALDQAREARLKILEVMRETIPEPRPTVSPNAPKIVSIEIPLDKIGEVIGPKGKTINLIQAETGADITIEDQKLAGVVTIGSKSTEAVEEARRRILEILDPPKAEIGSTYSGKVVNITKFGAFVNILPGRDGLLHISKLGKGERVARVEDVLELGQSVQVRVDDIDAQGKVSLSLVEDAPEPASAERRYVSFEEAFEPEVVAEYGELGPGPATGPKPQAPRRNDRRRPRNRRR